MTFLSFKTFIFINVPIKLMLMSAVEIKAEINRYLELVEDERFLKVVHSMLDTYLKESIGEDDPIIGYEVDGTPITASTFLKQAEESMAEVERGEYTTLEELEKESEEWLNRTK
jgi:hypothetical protein